MKILTLKSYLDNPYYLSNSNKDEVYLYVEVKAAKVEPKGERAPLNISLVIDRSGSMSGDKLEYAKKAADFVVKNLNKDDYLSLVQYDDVVDLVAASAEVKDKNALYQKIKGIQAGGMTNLSGGMMKGYQEVKSTKRDGFVNRVLLLSDGLANVGITGNEQLKDIARKQFRENGMGLSAFGLGEGFNEELMTGLAEHGGANYYFIEAADQIPQIFAKELEGLLSVVAQNSILEIELPADYFEVAKVYGYLYTQQGNRLQINFNDVFSEEEKAVVIKLKKKKAIDQLCSFGIQLNYDDVVETLDKVQETISLQLQPTSDKALYEAAINKEATENMVFFEANDRYEEIMRLSDSRQFDQAKAKLESLIGYMEAYVEMFPSSERLANQLNEIKAYLNRLPSMREMERAEFSMAQKMSKSVNYQMKKRKL
jgi:Ca-activated chloride channel family protein